MSHFDLHMTMILPEDISERISSFISGRLDFPFVKKDELISLLYLYGKSNEVLDHPERVLAIAKKTVETLEKAIEKYRNGPKSFFDSEYLRNNYIRRQLQITVDKNNNTENDKDAPDINKRRIINDPVILSECFLQHVAFYDQKYSFFFYGPLKENELTYDIRSLLSGKIVMLGYNKVQDELPFDHPIIPLYVWAKDNLRNND
ncbi:MAG: hypothetical protein QOK59_01985 [Nitrososphaeraceae archaeon]|nr:hypothetical protein [Nitrososphaeraceae archaeon]MDW0143893.1 hypothetical protein [Nitrososphaeraceae archaeon]MDW0145408.1 hypothetical protein [Nitrososphaeraceae archaeon]MDW0147434.1 hypothetical protein [Nitrososphaeraceae archaeon]